MTRDKEQDQATAEGYGRGLGALLAERPNDRAVILAGYVKGGEALLRDPVIRGTVARAAGLSPAELGEWNLALLS